MSFFLRPSRDGSLTLNVVAEIQDNLHEWISAYKQAQRRNLDLQRQIDQLRAAHLAQIGEARAQADCVRRLVETAGTFFTSEQRARLAAEAARLSAQLAPPEAAEQLAAWSSEGADGRESRTSH
ncbi:MAG: hypothetical protein JWN93_3740 [Hyphomicrobiales bacterium]|nr:hypothetical protein [Hyphomicrobiales bacterium]